MEDPLISAIANFFMSVEFERLVKQCPEEIREIKEKKAIFNKPHPICTLYALMNIERFRMEIFTLDYFKFYFLSMKSLRNIDYFITSEIMQSECNTILMKFIDLVCSQEGVDRMGYEFCSEIGTFIGHFKVSVKNYQEIQLSLYHCYMIGKELYSFVKINSSLLASQSWSLEEWKCNIKEVFIAVGSINSFIACYLIEKTHKFLEEYCREMIKNSKLQKKMNIYIYRLSPKISCQTVLCIIFQLEEKILLPLIKSKFSMKSNDIRSIALESILMDNLELFDYAELLYNETKVRNFPNIGYTLCLFLRSLLNHLHFDVYISYFNELYNTYGINSLYFFRQRIRYFEQFPEILQFRILEVARKLGHADTAALNYLFFTISPGMKQQALPDDWAKSFINLATSSPFKEVLVPFTQEIHH